MNNPRFFKDENIPLIQDEDRDSDYDDYNRSNKTLHKRQCFTDPDTKKTTSTFTAKTKSKTR